MRKKRTAFMLILSFLIAGISTGCDADIQKEGYSEVVAIRGDIVDGLTKEGKISVGNSYENVSLFVPESDFSEEEMEEQRNHILQIEEVYAVPGLAVNEGVPIIKVTDQSLQEYKTILENEQKKAERAVLLAEMEREEKSLDAEYTYKKSIEGKTTAKEKRDLAIKQLENNIKFLESEITACQQRISALKSENGSNLEIEVEENNLKDLENRLKAAQNEKEVKSIQIEQEYEQAQLDYTYAEDVRKSALEGLDDVVLQAQEYLATVKNAVEQFHTNMSDGSIKASYNGTVISVNCKAGEYLPSDKDIITYADSNQITMTVGIPQSKILSLYVGDEAAFKLDVYEGEVISGVIAGLEPNASGNLNENGYDVTVQVKDNEKKIYADMTGRVVFTEKAVRDVIMVPVEAIIREDTVSYVQTYDNNGKITKMEVKTGFSDGENVEITFGLEEGAKVFVKNMEEESEKTN